MIYSLDPFFNKATALSNSNQSKVKKLYGYIISKIVFLSILIFTLYACAKIFNWKLISQWIGSVISYLPNLAIISLMLMGGYLLGSFVKKYISEFFTSSTSDKKHSSLGTIAQFSIMTVISLMALEQLGIDTHFLTQILTVIVAVLVGGCIFSICLGARSLTTNVIGAQYAKKILSYWAED